MHKLPYICSTPPFFTRIYLPTLNFSYTHVKLLFHNSFGFSSQQYYYYNNSFSIIAQSVQWLWGARVANELPWKQTKQSLALVQWFAASIHLIFYACLWNVDPLYLASVHNRHYEIVHYLDIQGGVLQRNNSQQNSFSHLKDGLAASSGVSRKFPNPMLIGRTACWLRQVCTGALVQISTPLNGATVRKIASSNRSMFSFPPAAKFYSESSVSILASCRPPVREGCTSRAWWHQQAGSARAKRPGAGVLLFYSVTRRREPHSSPPCFA